MARSCLSASGRRCGVATMLLLRALEVMASSGTRQVFLEVGISNHAACRLYAKFGFRAVGRRQSYYGNGGGRVSDAIVEG